MRAHVVGVEFMGFKGVIIGHWGDNHVLLVTASDGFQSGGGTHLNIMIYTLNGLTGSALVWHSRGRLFDSRLVQQVFRFIGRVNTVQYVELRGHCP